MRILIIGGGLAGLSMYLQLRARTDADRTQVTILERHASSASPQDDSPSTFRGGLGVAPNGMRVLRRLDSSLHAAVRRAGFTVRHHEFRTAGGYVLGRWPAASTADPREGTCMVERRALWRILRTKVPDADVWEGAEVVEIRAETGTVVLRDGRTVTADVIIGADGVRSVARQAVVDREELGYEAEFQNLMNVGGYVPNIYLSKPLSDMSPSSVMIFGPRGFVGYVATSCEAGTEGNDRLAPVPSDDAMWWSTYTDDPSTAERRTTNAPSDPALRVQMAERHGSWASPTIQRIIRDLNADAAEIAKDPGRVRATLDLHTPTWIVPKLPRWTRGRVWLVGDAAHALPSSSGQGVSQALEDSVAVAWLLAKTQREMGREGGTIMHEVVEKAAKDYEKVRKKHVERILDDALRMQSHKQNLNWFELGLMYAILWLVIRLGRGKQEEWRFDYDVEKEMETCSS